MRQKFENRYVCKCEICNHQWLSRNDKVPRRCSNIDCQSFKWNRGIEEIRLEPIEEKLEECERKYIYDPTDEHEIEAKRILVMAEKYEKEEEERLKKEAEQHKMSIEKYRQAIIDKKRKLNKKKKEENK